MFEGQRGRISRQIGQNSPTLRGPEKRAAAAGAATG